MALSNFNAGFAGGISVRGIPLIQTHPGRVFWVGNAAANVDATQGIMAGSDANKGTFQRPFATLDYAIGQCAADRGDIIFIKPGHAETVASAAAIAVDVAGVAIIGLGQGSKRPTFNFTATAATITVSAANCSLKNLLLTGGIDAVVSPLVVSGADCVLDSLTLRDVTGQMTDGVLTTAGADRLRITRHRHEGDTAAGTNTAIALVGGTRIDIDIEHMVGNFAVGGINIRTTATTLLSVHDVDHFRTTNAADIFIVDTITGSTGQIGPYLNLRLQDNAANITEACTGATFVYMQPINIVNLAGEASMQTNITASTDA